MRRFVHLLGMLALLLSVGAFASVGSTAGSARAEFRAYWVDAFGPGIYNEAEIDKLVADVKAANLTSGTSSTARERMFVHDNETSRGTRPGAGTFGGGN